MEKRLEKQWKQQKQQKQQNKDGFLGALYHLYRAFKYLANVDFHGIISIYIYYKKGNT